MKVFVFISALVGLGIKPLMPVDDYKVGIVPDHAITADVLVCSDGTRFSLESFHPRRKGDAVMIGGRVLMNFQRHCDCVMRFDWGCWHALRVPGNDKAAS